MTAETSTAANGMLGDSKDTLDRKAGSSVSNLACFVFHRVNALEVNDMLQGHTAL